MTVPEKAPTYAKIAIRVSDLDIGRKGNPSGGLWNYVGAC
jgi:hypothetical protein